MSQDDLEARLSRIDRRVRTIGEIAAGFAGLGFGAGAYYIATKDWGWDTGLAYLLGAAVGIGVAAMIRRDLDR